MSLSLSLGTELCLSVSALSNVEYMNTKYTDDNFLPFSSHVSHLIKSDLLFNLVLSDGGHLLQGLSADLITPKKAILSPGRQDLCPGWPG